MKTRAHFGVPSLSTELVLTTALVRFLSLVLLIDDASFTLLVPSLGFETRSVIFSPKRPDWLIILTNLVSFLLGTRFMKNALFRYQIGKFLTPRDHTETRA